jgi:hypothetical protein
MADDTQSAAATDEQDFSIPGQGDSDTPPSVQMTPGAPPSAVATPSTPQMPTYDPGDEQQTDADMSGPKVSGRAMFLGNLLKTILVGGAAGVASSGSKFGNAVKAGMQAGDPAAKQLKQAKVQTALSEADQAKLQTSITGMKALQYEYLLKRLPQEDQLAHLKSISDFKQYIIKEGATVEAEGDDEKASDAQAMHLNGTDPRALNHTGKFYSLPTMDEDGKPKFDIVFVPSKDTLQSDYTWTDPDGNEQTIPAGTPMSGALGKFVEAQQKGAQNQTKEQHKQLGDALKPNVPDTEIPQTVGWLENQQKQNTPLYQQNKNAVDAQINTLKAAHSQAQADKIAQQRAGAQIRQEGADEKANKGASDALNYASIYEKESPTGSGDEALMEKFFELAKPSTGFRMSQPQIQMLATARSWMDSAEAKAMHATKGTWFSDDQRKQIIHTMKDLAAAKQMSTTKSTSTKESSDKSTSKAAKDPFTAFGGSQR